MLDSNWFYCKYHFCWSKPLHSEKQRYSRMECRERCRLQIGDSIMLIYTPLVQSEGRQDRSMSGRSYIRDEDRNGFRTWRNKMSLGIEYKSVLSHTHTLSLTISLSHTHPLSLSLSHTHTLSLTHTQKSIMKDRPSGLSTLRYTLVSHANMTINDAIHDHTHYNQGWSNNNSWQ